VVGDWDGDGKDTIGLYDPATGTWFLRNSNSSAPADLVFTYGPEKQGFLPIVGDWDGDGKDTVGLYDPAKGVWFLTNSNSGGNADITFMFGVSGAKPIAGRWE